MSWAVELVGGERDGERIVLPYPRELRLFRLLPVKWAEVEPTGTVAYAVSVYGPATEADRLLNRWSLLRVEKWI